MTAGLSFFHGFAILRYVITYMQLNIIITVAFPIIKVLSRDNLQIAEIYYNYSSIKHPTSRLSRCRKRRPFIVLQAIEFYYRYYLETKQQRRVDNKCNSKNNKPTYRVSTTAKRKTETMTSGVSMDYMESPLHPCSVETIAEPVQLADGSRIWPTMLGCYELQQESGTRHGRLDLYAIKVPDLRKNLSLQASMVLKFGNPISVMSREESQQSGILDGKWIQAPNHSMRNDDLDDGSEHLASFYFASALSTGEIAIHACSVKSTQESDRPVLPGDPEECAHPMHVELRGKTDNFSTKLGEKDRAPLCLSLNWDRLSFDDESTRIVSTYSDGCVSVHDVISTKQSTMSSQSKLQLVEHVSWEAHTMFTSPAEVWLAGFVGGSHTHSVMSGGDDGSLKLWDIRSINRPMQVLKHFDAGVTVVAPHPRLEHLVACGSYDETICLYDIRYLSPSSPLGRRSGPLGGGIWRIKWHPYDDYRILVAAMHGGARVVQIDTVVDGDDHETPVMVATKEFNEHKSMAYGADWLVCNHPTQEGYFEAAATCSFYDKAVYLWDTVAS